MKNQQIADPFGQTRTEIQSTQHDETAALLQRMVHLLESLPARLAFELANKRQAAAISKADRELLAIALPAIAAAVGEKTWAVADLAAEQPAAFAVLNQKADGSEKPNRRVGKQLARCEGVGVNGLAIRRVGPSRDGALWRIARVS